jgi:hypothetical protein
MLSGHAVQSAATATDGFLLWAPPSISDASKHHSPEILLTGVLIEE